MKTFKRASMFLEMVEEVCFLKSWTLTKTAISKWVFNPYRQDLGYWKSRLMKINCIYSPKWLSRCILMRQKKLWKINGLDSSSASCTRRTMFKVCGLVVFIAIQLIKKGHFLEYEKAIINFNPPLLYNTQYYVEKANEV